MDPGTYEHRVVRLYLSHQPNESIDVQFSFAIINDVGKHQFETGPVGGSTMCWAPYAHGMTRRGWQNFALYSDVIKHLVKGSLIVEVRMKVTGSGNGGNRLICPFTPGNPLTKNILNMFMDEATADIVFEVRSSGLAIDTQKKAKNSTIFHAHRFILQQWAQSLGELCKSGEEITTIEISDVSPHIFHQLLYFSYGGEVKKEDMSDNEMDLIDASDKYGVVGLKFEAEASLVASTTFTMENVMDILLYADGKNCALLKEAAIDFLAENAEEGIKQLSFDHCPGHLVKDLLTIMARGKKATSANQDSSDLSTTRVCALRKMLHEKGLDADGSREMMIARLEQNFSIACDDEA